MKKTNKLAYQYVRISTKDQSNWSIDGQLQINREYAERQGLTIISTFIDDGRSAKDFDRPEWKRLEKAVTSGREHVSFVIVTKYDRLVRNAWQGLKMLEKIENSLGARVLSAMESYEINPEDPMYFKIRADLLVNAEFERRIISDRARFGLWQARSQGRYVGKAPFGYLNARDDNNKPIIVPDPDKKNIIEYIFRSYVLDIPIKTIHKEAKKMGFDRHGKSAIQYIITNPTYAGLIFNKAYKNHDTEIVKGIHEGIISESMFYAAKNKWNRKERSKHVQVSEDFPLRGYVYCHECRKPLTGANSKGRNKYYGYYHCRECRKNYRSEIAHDQIKTILSHFSWSRNQMQVFYDALDQEREFNMKEKASSVKILRKQKRDKESQIESLEEKFLADSVSPKTYQKWYSKYNEELHKIEAQLLRIESLSHELFDNIESNLEALCRLDNLFEDTDAYIKQEIYTLVFPYGSSKTDWGYRTGYINELFIDNLKKVKELGLVEMDSKHFLGARSPVRVHNRSIVEPEQLFEITRILRKLA